MSSGLNWMQPKSLRQADPYLAWADLTNYASYRLSKEPGKRGWWLVLIELTQGNKRRTPIDRLMDASTPQWLQVSDVYLDKHIQRKHFRFCTARVGQAFFEAVLTGSLKNVVSRYKLCSPVEYPVEPLRHPDRPKEGIVKATHKLAGDSKKGVIAVIDGGLAFANSTFLDDCGNTRLTSYWRQDDYLGSRYLRDRIKTGTKAKRTAPWKKVKDLGYGAEMDRQGMNAAISKSKKSASGRIDESAVYDQLGLWDLDRLVHHGTHVASLAVGSYRYPREPGTQETPPFWQGAEGSDPQGKTCDVIAVQLAWANILDTSCRACDAYILDALMYTWARTHQDAHLVVNLSWGGAAGPHDGSSILEQAMLAWCDLRKPELTQIVVPAGNNYQSRMHANAVVKTEAALELTWRIPPDGQTPNFLELWFDQLTENLSVELVAPNGDKQGMTVSSRKPSAKTLKRGGQVVAALVLVERSYLGTGPMALIAIEPTAGPGSLAWSGQWRVTVSSVQEVKVDAFVERNDVAIGLFTGAKQSYLEDSRYNVGAPRDMATPGIGGPDNQSPIRRRGSFNHLSTGSDGRRVFSVGGICDLQIKKGKISAASYSPPWEMAVQTRPRRPHTKEEPDTVGISEHGCADLGLRAAATRSGAVVPLVGTSSAVPQVARLLINEDGLPPHPLPPTLVPE